MLTRKSRPRNIARIAIFCSQSTNAHHGLRCKLLGLRWFFERAARLPVPDNLAAIRAALETASVEFMDPNGGGPGVRLKSCKKISPDCFSSISTHRSALLAATSRQLSASRWTCEQLDRARSPRYLTSGHWEIIVHAC